MNPSCFCDTGRASAGSKTCLRFPKKFKGCRETEEAMGKIKTHKATAKRFTVTKSGKVKLNHSNRRHKLGLKTSKRKRLLRKAGYLSESMAPTVKSLISRA